MVRAREFVLFKSHINQFFLHSKVAPGGLIFGFLLSFTSLENLEPKQLRERHSFTQDRSETFDVDSDPFERDIFPCSFF